MTGLKVLLTDSILNYKRDQNSSIIEHSRILHQKIKIILSREREKIEMSHQRWNSNVCKGPHVFTRDETNVRIKSKQIYTTEGQYIKWHFVPLFRRALPRRIKHEEIPHLVPLVAAVTSRISYNSMWCTRALDKSGERSDECQLLTTLHVQASEVALALLGWVDGLMSPNLQIHPREAIRYHVEQIVPAFLSSPVQAW